MEYVITIQGKRHVLPKRTLEIDSQIEQIERLSKDYLCGKITRTQIVEAQYNFIQHCTENSLGSLETLDTNELLQHTVDILNVYNAPAIETQRKATLANVSKLVNSPEFGKLLSLSNLASSV